ncbi:ABC transporter ATP-binding protein [Paludicola sp. MB14-C6]|uniref:ABC transporter ATP-binding protein n=1 Tax=Paludihabitans sp. MB14-C6 TaxID=3070656 RepID=UPI0027DAF29A|nr:ABC transporter ATP-binding protein [Paludicola sp. MB14-C6]WMJ24408.1 ABC transporter ATP-binding protein [Paludicola sp. MB14-C6]
MEYILKTNGLTKSYVGRPVVNNVNMHVRKGDIYGFIGKNGAGKTTLIRMVSGLAAPTKGNMELFESKELTKKRAQIGTIIEAPSLYPNMSARENLEYYRMLYGIPSKKRVDEVLTIVSLNNTGKKKARNFSLGMRQRLGVAIALLSSPDFLILDEPINGLDPTGVKDMRDLILRLNKEHNITILISSHILGELSKIATCYGIINNGFLVDEFTAVELSVRCKRCIKMQVDDVKKASTLVESHFQTTNFDILPDNTLRLFDHLDQTGAINKLLVSNDVTVSELRISGQDLEGYFLELMGGLN